MSIDWALFWQMGGHAGYVFGAYGGALALVALEACWLWRGARRAAALAAAQREGRP